MHLKKMVIGETKILSTKTPKWSISEQKFIDCDNNYRKAQEDIVPELKKLGKDHNKLKEWMKKNNADFELTAEPVIAGKIEDIIKKEISTYKVSDDPYDVALAIGEKYKWTKKQVEQAEKIIRKKYIK